MNKSEVKSILFITLSNLGDIILTTPVLEKLRDEFPGSCIDVVTGKPGQEIFLRSPVVREIIVREKRQSFTGRLNEIMKLRRKRYDLVVDLKNSLIPYIIGARFFSRLSFSSKGKTNDKHKRDEHLLKLHSLGIDPFCNNRFFICATPDEKNYIRGIVDSDVNKRIVVINPGAKSHLKRWPAEKYAELAGKISAELGLKVIVVGGKEDKEVIEKMLALAKSSFTNLCGKTTIGELFELMKIAELVITNDSAPLHVASAANVPTIALFGPSDERKYGPLSDKNAVIKPNVSCRPCSKALCAVGPDEGCMGEIEVDEVFNAAKKMLSAESRDRFPARA